MPFENVLNYTAFSLRLPEADIPRLPAILASVTQDTIDALLAGVRRVRTRFTYSSIAANELRISVTPARYITESPSQSQLLLMLAPESWSGAAELQQSACTPCSLRISVLGRTLKGARRPTS